MFQLPPGVNPATFGERPQWLPDVNTTSRKDYTKVIVEREIPNNAATEYQTEVKRHQELVKLLYDDPAMEPNREQTFMTPANSKNRVYFMWDFCQRNLVIMLNLDPTLPYSQKAAWDEVKGRCAFSSILILDDSGKMNAMVPGDNLTFSDEIKSLVTSWQN
jgi:hypothetical protein